MLNEKQKFFFYSIVFLFTLLCYIGDSKKRKTKHKSFQFNSIRFDLWRQSASIDPQKAAAAAPCPPSVDPSTHPPPPEYLSPLQKSHTQVHSDLICVCKLGAQCNKQSAKDTKNNNNRGTDLKRTNKKKKNQVCTFPPPHHL